MRPELPWNVAGIPPEAREAARAAARREGLSVGEWLTRRILRSFADAGDPGDQARGYWPSSSADSAASNGNDDSAPTRRDSDAMLARVSRSENDSQDAFRRIEEQLRSLSRRLDATERSQAENNRAMSKAATEINIAAREQTQAFDQLGSHVVGLNERLERVERQAEGSGTKEAVKALQQGLSRLADQISQTAHESTAQIASLAGNVESLAAKFLQTKNETDRASQTLEQRLKTLDDRILAAEKASQVLEKALEALDARQASTPGIEPELQRQAAAMAQLGDTLDRLNTRLAANEAQSAGAMARVEESIARLESRGSDSGLDRRLAGIERLLSEISGRLDKTERDTAGVRSAAEESIRSVHLLIEDSERKNRDAIADLRKALDGVSARLQPAAPGNAPGPGPQPTNLDLPPFAADAPPAFHAPPADPFAAPPQYQPPPAADPFAPQSAFDAPHFAGDQLPPNGPQGVFAPPQQQPFGAQNAPGETYLSAARRAARSAAMQADAERARGPMGAFTWGANRPIDATEKPKPKRYGLIAGLAFIAILAAVAGVMLSQRMNHGGSTTPERGLGALFQNKPAQAPRPAPALPAATQTIAAPTPATSVPGSPVLPAQQPPLPAARAAAGNPPGPAPSAGTSALHPVVPPKPAAAAVQQPAKPAPNQVATISPLARLSALAEKGDANAQTLLGLKYLDGDGVPQNDNEAVKWFRKAAAQGQPVAEYRLGTLFERGRGVQGDAKQAAHWYLQAATHGNRKAMHNLAVAYAEGAGVAKNYSEAARWFSRAANLGLADSQFNLAVLYERGLGVPQSLVDAYKWYAIAAAQGDTESKNRIDALGTQLTADERAAAQKAAAAFSPQPLNRASNVPPEMGSQG